MGFSIEQMVRMSRNGSKTVMPLILVKLSRDQAHIYNIKELVKTVMPLILVKLSRDQAHIYNIKELVGLDVSVEALKSRPGVGQCFRCQRFGHKL
ncbi:hypothetical protein QE152_g33641 [Popillia japonica]|uniref:Uncharacterized protein n=1 Tax=Popillia japonica TaxID=7064 RepID=A0AAW1IWE4_POPJA